MEIRAGTGGSKHGIGEDQLTRPKQEEVERAETRMIV